MLRAPRVLLGTWLSAAPRYDQAEEAALAYAEARAGATSATVEEEAEAAAAREAAMLEVGAAGRARHLTRS